MLPATQKKRSAASAAQKAADMAREAQQKRAAENERASEEEESRSEEESDGDARESDPEEGAAGGSERGSHEEGGVTKENTNCSFSAKKEECLVEFFNPAFYDKSHPNYQKQQQKDKILDQLAKELHTTRKRIQGWFKHMRTSVGKLYKTKSGQATKPLTARKKWQLQNFAFLKAYIVPCTYTVETTPLEETGEQSEDEESLLSIPTRPASPSSSTSTAARKTKPPASKKAKIDDLLIKFLDRPRPEEVLSK